MKKAKVLFLILGFLVSSQSAEANPTISAQPASRTNNVGDNAQFAVTATGSGTPTYQWKFNDADIAGATTSTLNVLVTNGIQAGDYKVTVTDSAGSIDSSAAALSIPFANRGKLTQWNFNSTTPNNNTANGVDTPSVGSGTMTWSGATGNNWNDGSPSDPASSDNSSRRWNALMSTTPNKTGGAKFAVSTVGYKAVAVSGELWLPARGSAYWRGQYTTNGTVWTDRVLINRRGASLAGFIYFSDDLSGADYVSNNANFAYRVVAEWQSTATGSGSDAYVAVDPGQTFPGTGGLFGWDMVTVLGTVDDGTTQPVITTQPQSQTGSVGGNVTLTVVATGGSLQYQWRILQGGVPIDIPNATGSSLVLANIQTIDAGTYSVRVSNASGFAVSSDAVLTVESAPPAGDRFWSGDGAALGGTGTWDTTGHRWGVVTSGPFTLGWNNSGLDSANFNVPEGTVTVGEAVTVNKIVVVGDADYTFAGTSAITFANNAEFNCTSTRNNAAVTFTCPLAATTLQKTGAGRMHLNNAANNVDKFVVTGGVISVNSGSSLGTTPAALVADRVTLDGGGLGFDGTSPSLSATRGLSLGAGGGKLGTKSGGSVTLTINAPITGPGGISFPSFNAFHGSSVYGANTRFVFNNPLNDYQGATTVTVGELRLGANEVLPNTTALTLNGSSSSSFQGRVDLFGHNETVGSVIANGTGAAIYDTVGGGTLTAASYDLRTSRTGGGVNCISAILAGAAALTKTTTGEVELGGANTYTGGTVIDAGILRVNNASGSGTGPGAVTVNTGGTLEGNGAVAGVVTVNPGGTLAPGTSIGTLTLGSSPSLGGNVLMELSTASTPTSDKLVVNGALAYGGTLTLSNIGPALVGGETFDLFDASGGFSEAFTSIVGSPGAGLNYWGGNLTTDGTILINRAPVGAGDHAYSRGKGTELKIRKADLLAGVSDLDAGDSVSLSLANSGSQGATVTETANYIFYAPANDNNDIVKFKVADTRGGATTNQINIAIVNEGGLAQGISYAAGGVTVRFAGIPGITYDVQRASDLSFTTDRSIQLTTNCPPTGLFIYTDASPLNPSGFYQLLVH